MVDALALILGFTGALTTSVCTLEHPQLESLATYGVILEFYDVKGHSEEELHNSIIINGPRDRAGEPRDAHFSWQFQLDRRTSEAYSTLVEEIASGGELASLIKIKLTLPCFRGINDASYGVQASWVKYLDRLISHEARHAIHFFRALPKLEYAIKTANEELFWTEISALKRKDREYDHHTRHGASEGARLGRVCYKPKKSG